MNVDEAKERSTEASVRLKARIAGVAELLEGLTSASGQVFILGKFIVSGNAAATAANILARPGLYWLGFGASLVAVGFHIVWALFFYQLFKPVNRSVSQLALSFMLVGCALQALTSLLQIAPLLVLQSGSVFSAFTPAQLQAFAYILLKLNAEAFNVYLVFFGAWCVLAGYLIFRSGFLPRVLGALLVVDGLGWMIYLCAPLAYRLFPFIAAASGIAEVPLPWFLMFGLNVRRWRERAIAAGEWRA
jgi:hypothetical protein